ncbi:MAG: DNA helicase [Gammaproteobacteria bacterium]|nr:MAG: DNA helicase [Gammaproteobacteria bacterium]
MSNQSSNPPNFDSLNVIEQRLTEIEAERSQLLLRKKLLLKQATTAQQTFSPEEKVQLFQNLFKGRADVFASRWQNSQGRSGYSVACHNEWQPKLCNKPRVKCNECKNRNYKDLNSKTLYDHLAGKLVVGLYPLLHENTCHLLVADFDKNDWKNDIQAMAKTCKNYHIPHAIEISRSGNGAHLWIFFLEAVSAKDARLLGFGLLDKAMEIHPNLSFDSYDRLFPNQDIMPEGGFGNLIALPLQFHARRQGNSLFVDEHLIPYSDQWHFLSQIASLSSKQLNDLIVQLRPHSQQATDNRPPWEQGAKIKSNIIDNCPKEITLILANHIYINLDEIPATLIAQLKRLASFSNPVFFKTQALRFSTNGIPRYISCARIEQNYLSLPRGCYDEVISLLSDQNISIIFDDKREQGTRLKSLKFYGKLRKEQSKAVNVINKFNTGILHAPTAFGKTITAIGLISKRKVNTLILTHSRQLLDQWQERLKLFMCDAEIGVIGGGKRKPTGQIDVATYQSLINKKENTIDQLVQDYGQIIIDECHHISAPRFEMVLNEVRAKYVVGLTATPERQDGHQKIIFMLAGPIRYKAKSNHADKFEQLVVVTQLEDQPPSHLVSSEERPRISDAYHWLMANTSRTQKIVEDVIKTVVDGKHPLVLTERREHAEIINQFLSNNNIHSVVLRGAMRAKERKDANEQLADAQVIVATGKYIGEGFDLLRLDTLFLAMPIAWKGSLTQYAGRIHRESVGKDKVTIYDYVDSSLPMLARMFRKREKGYKAMGYRISTPLR